MTDNIIPLVGVETKVLLQRLDFIRKHNIPAVDDMTYPEYFRQALTDPIHLEMNMRRMVVLE